MINILRNSVKFTLEGEIKLCVRKNYKDNGIELEFYDSGIGIDSENIKQLFKIFGKLADPNKINNEGIGLGLYITSNLVKQLGGSLDVESEKNKFTKFILTIPDARPSDENHEELLKLAIRSSSSPLRLF